MDGIRDGQQLPGDFPEYGIQSAGSKQDSRPSLPPTADTSGQALFSLSIFRMIHPVHFINDSWTNSTMKPLKILTVSSQPAWARLGASAVTHQLSCWQGTPGRVRGEMLSQAARNRPTSHSSPVFPQLPKATGRRRQSWWLFPGKQHPTPGLQQQRHALLIQHEHPEQ